MPDNLIFIIYPQNLRAYLVKLGYAAVLTLAALILIAVSMTTQAVPTNMGTFTITSANTSSGSASGNYITSTGSKGKFTLVRNEMRGYQNNVSFLPTLNSTSGNINGIEVKNEENIAVGQDRDKFKYTFTITPDDNTAVHTIKIAQASYSTSGNSEIARHTLAFIKNNGMDIPVQAVVKNNPNVNYYYNAMGDYFMGSRISNTQLSSQNPSIDTLSGNQVRVDSSINGESNLYYYNISNLVLKSNTNSSPYTPSLNSKGEVALSTNNGVLPSNPTFSRIFKNLTANNSYSALAENSTISNGGTYVTYGVENSVSNYVIAVKNATAVTLTYEGIMNGNIGIPRSVVGETFSEWISFGVSSEPNHVISGTVFNDNGSIPADINSQYNTSSTFTGNENYFNGIFNAHESGIYNSGLRISLTDCNGSTIVTHPSTPNPQTVSSDPKSLGHYNFTVLPRSLESKTNLCLEEIEPNNWDYSVDTTPNIRKFVVNPNLFIYKTGIENNGTILNLDFGEVESHNGALILKKYQYIHDCNDTLNYKASHINANNILKPTDGFSINPVSSINPGKCIAYKIEAYNRGHIDLADIQISDTLQNSSVKSVLHLPKPLGDPTTVFKNTNTSAIIGKNGTIQTDKFTLLKPPLGSTSATKASLYFNTNYSITDNN